MLLYVQWSLIKLNPTKLSRESEENNLNTGKVLNTQGFLLFLTNQMLDVMREVIKYMQNRTIHCMDLLCVR